MTVVQCVLFLSGVAVAGHVAVVLQHASTNTIYYAICDDLWAHGILRQIVKDHWDAVNMPVQHQHRAVDSWL